MTNRRWRALACAGLFLSDPAVADAQTNVQLWGNITFNWVKSERLTYELDFEPKVLLDAPEGEPGWRNLDLTPNVEYSVKRWLDLVADATVGFTKAQHHRGRIQHVGQPHRHPGETGVRSGGT